MTLSRSFADMHRVVKTPNRLTHTSPAEVKQGNSLPSYFSFYPVNKVPFDGMFSVMFFSFACFSLVITLFKMVSTHNAEELCGDVPENEIAGAYLGEKIHMLGKFHLVMTYSVLA